MGKERNACIPFRESYSPARCLLVSDLVNFDTAYPNVIFQRQLGCEKKIIPCWRRLILMLMLMLIRMLMFMLMPMLRFMISHCCGLRAFFLVALRGGCIY